LPILHSKDLINWQIVNYALRDLNMEGVEPNDFFDKPQHGKGVWAPCIRYHNGEYLIYWGDPDFGIYVVKWKDGWLVMGINEKDYCGEPVLTYKKTNVGTVYPIETPVESDKFNTANLGLQWPIV
jgi:beta-xylosidase